MIKIYAGMENSDLTEGRGPMVAKGYFLNRADAEAFASTVLMGVMGVGCGEVKELDVYEDISEHPRWTTEMLKKSALAKLTKAERAALGV